MEDFLRVLAEDPDNIEVYESAASLLAGEDKWEELVDLSESLAHRLSDSVRAADLLYQAGVLHHERLGRVDKMVEDFSRVLELVPMHEKTCKALEELYESAEDWPNLIAFLEREETLSQEPQAKAEYLYRIAELYRHRLNQVDQALTYYQRAFKAFPQFTKALSAARDVYREQGNHKLVIRLLDLQRQVATTVEEKGDLLYEMGKVYGEELHQEEQALQCYRQVLEVRPDDERASEAIEYINAIRENWRKIVEKYESEAKDAAEPELASSLLLRIAEILFKNTDDIPAVEAKLRESLDKNSSNDKAISFLDSLLRKDSRLSDLLSLYEDLAARVESDERRLEIYRNSLLEIDPGHEGALTFLQGHLAVKGEWEELTKVYERALKTRTDPQAEMGLLLQIGMLLWKQAESMDQAEVYFRRIKKFDPRHPSVMDFYSEFYRNKGDWKHLLDTLVSELRKEKDKEAKIKLGVKIATIAEVHLGNMERAIDAWKGVLDLDPEREEAQESLCELYRQTGKWNALLEYYKRRVHLIEANQEKVKLLLEMAEIYRDRLSMDLMVINTYNTILQIDPANILALDALAEKYESLSRWNDLIGVLRRKADVLEPPQDRIPFLERIAKLWIDKFRNHNQAIRPLEEILEIDPRYREAIDLLRQIYERRRDWRKLLEVLKKEVDIIEEPEQRKERLVELAHMAQDKLNLAHEAVQLWNKVLEFNHQDPRALEALEPLYEEEKRWPELVEICRRRLAALEDSRVKIALYAKLGQIYGDRLKLEDRAVDCWNRILELDPEHSMAQRVLTDTYLHRQDWENLEGLYARAEKWRDFVGILGNYAERTTESPIKIQLFFKMAEVCDVRLKDRLLAVRCYERILAIEPDNLTVARALIPVYTEAGDWRKLIGVLEIVLGHSSGDEAFDLVQQLWRLHEEKLRQKDKAFQWCNRAFRLRPGDLEVRAELERLAGEVENWDDLVASYIEILEQVEDEDLKVALTTRVAEINHRCLGRVDEAKGFYLRVLNLRPHAVPILDALADLYFQAGRWTDLSDIFRRKLKVVEDDASRRDILLSLGRLLEEALEDPEGAVQAYKEALAIDDRNQGVIAALKRLYDSRGAWPDLVGLLGHELEGVSGAEAVVEIKFQLGELWRHHLLDLERAVGTYVEILGLVSRHGPTVAALEHLLAEGKERLAVSRALEPVYIGCEEWQKLSEIYEVQLEFAAPGEERIDLLRKNSSLYEDRLADSDAAWRAWSRMFRENPTAREVWANLERLTGILQNWEALAELYASSADSLEDREARNDLVRRLARINDEELDHGDAAQGYYRLLLAEDPQDREAIDALDRLYSRGEQWNDLVELYLQKADLAESKGDKLELLFKICGLYEEYLDSPPKAIEIYQRILDFDEQNRQAIGALERLYEYESRWQDLAQLLVRELDFVDGAEHVVVKHRLGDLFRTRLSDLHQAVLCYRDVLALQPDHQEALTSLEQLLAIPDHRLDISRILEPLYRQADMAAKLIGVLEIQLEFVEDKDQRVDLLSQIAQLYELKEAQFDKAFESVARAFREDPENEAVKGELERLADGIDQFDHLIGEYDHALSRIDNRDLAIVLTGRIAEIYRDRLSDPAQSQVYYRRVLVLAPENANALDALEDLYTQGSQWEDLVGVLERKAALAEDPAERKEFHRRVGKVWEEVLSESSKAIESYSTILDIDNQDRNAIDALERLYRETEQWTELVSIHHRCIEMVGSSDEQRLILYQVAEIFRFKLNDLEEAITVYRSILDLASNDPDSIAALDQLFVIQERWIDLLDILARELEMAEGVDQRVELYFRMGQLLEQRLDSPERAIECYRTILQADPTHDQALMALERFLGVEEQQLLASQVLEPVYYNAAEWEKLVGVYELQIHHEQDVGARVAFLGRIAEVYENQLDASDRAFEALSRSLTESPTNEFTSGELWRIAEKTAKWEDYCQVVATVIERIDDPSLAMQYDLTLAFVYFEKLRDLDLARSYFRKVLDFDQENREALQALEHLFLETEQWEDLLQIYRRKVDLADDPEARKGIYFKISKLCEEVLGRHEEAIEAYKEILHLDESNAEALLCLEHLYLGQEAWSDLAEILLRRLQVASGDSEVVDLKHRLGDLWLNRLDSVDLALESFREVLQRDATHEPTIQALEGLLFAETPDPVRQPIVGKILEPVYEALDEWDRLVKTQEVLLEHLVAPEERVAILAHVASIHEVKRGDVESAYTAWCRALKEDMGSRNTWRELSRLADLLGRWDDLANLFVALASNDEFRYMDVSVAEEFILFLAKIYDDKLGELNQARDHYRRVLELNPENTEAIDALERLYTRTEQWRDLVALYKRKADLTDDIEDKKNLYFKVCHLYEDLLEDPVSAIEVYRNILDLDPIHAQSLKALARIYGLLGRYHELADLLRRELVLTEDRDKIVEIKFRLGEILERELDDISGAIDCYQEILAQDRTHDLTLAALERLLGDEDYRERVAAILEPYYLEAEDWRKLIGIYEVQLEFLQDRYQRVSLLQRVADLHERELGDKAMAFQALGRALGEDYGNEEIQIEFERLAEELSAWDRLIYNYIDGLQRHLDDYPLAVRMLIRMAEIYEEQLGHIPSAQECYRNVLALDPNHMPAIEALERLYTQDADWANLVVVIQRKAELTDDVMDRKDLYYRVGELFESTLVQLEQAIYTYQIILSIDEEDMAAIEALERLYLQTSRWADLVGVLQRRVAIVLDPHERRDIYFKIAQLQVERLIQPQEAIETYKTVLGLFDNDLPSIQALDHLYLSQRLWVDLLDILQVELSLASSAEERVELTYRMGELFWRELDDLDRAIECFRTVLGEQADHGRAQSALEALLQVPSHQVMAAKVLEPFYREAGDWKKLVDVHELEFKALDDPASKVDLLQRVAEIYEKGLSSKNMAFLSYGRAFREQPSNIETIESLERLATEMGNWVDLVLVYEEQVDNIYEADLAKSISLKIAHLYDECLGQPDDAVLKYRKVLDLDPQDREALVALDRLYRQLNQLEPLAEIIQSEIEGGTDTDEIITFRFRLANLQEQALDKVPEAIDNYQSILDYDPTHEGARTALEGLLSSEPYREMVVSILEPLYRQSMDWTHLVSLYELKQQIAPNPSERSMLLQELARIYEEQLIDANGALNQLGRALQVDPSNEVVCHDLERLAEDLGAWDKLAGLYETVVEEVPDQSQRLNMLLKVARWYDERLEDVAKAAEKYGRVLEIDPDDMEALGALESIYQRLEMWVELVDVYQRRAKLTFDLMEKKDIYFKIARICEGPLADAIQSAAALRMVLELDDRDMEALTSLERIYLAEGRYEELVDVLNRQGDLTYDAEERAVLKHRIAEIYGRELNNPDQAITNYLDVLDIKPDDLVAAKALDDLYTQQENWDSLIDILNRQLSQTDDTARKVELLMKISVVYEQKLNNPDFAIESFRQVLDLEEAYPEAFAGLERLLEVDERWFELVEIIDRHASLTSDPQEIISLRIRAGRVRYDKMSDIDGAIDIFNQVLQADPNHREALTALAGLYERVENWAYCIEILEKALALATTPQDQAILYGRIGRIFLDKMADKGQAETYLLSSIELSPTNQEAIAALRNMYEEEGDWAKAVEMMRREEAALTDPQAKLTLLKQIGSLCFEKLKDYQGAARALQEVMTLDPDDTGAMLSLEDIYFNACSWEEAKDVLERIVQKYQQSRQFKEVAKYAFRLAFVYEKMGNMEEALNYYNQSYNLNVTYLPTLQSLGRLLFEKSDWDKALKIYQTILLHQIDQVSKEERVDIFYKLGVIRIHKNEVRKAKSMFERALGVDASHEPSKEMLEKTKAMK